MTNETLMKECIRLGNIAKKHGDIPVGAIIVKDNKIISKAYNLKQKKQVSTYHAEVLAIEKACKKLKDFRLSGCTLYVTKEPCLMCMGAILSARINHIVFGSFDKKYGAIHLSENNNFNHTCTYTGGVLEDECSAQMSEFFKTLRQSKKKNKIIE